MATITINGQNYVGNNVTVNGNKVIIDGKDVTPETKEINITVNGDIEKIDVDYCKEIRVATGNVGTIRTTSGNVFCNNVYENIMTTSGDIKCNVITGDVETLSGDVSAGVISGTVETLSGDVKYNK